MSEKKIRIPVERYEWPDERRLKRQRRLRTLFITIGLIVAFGFGYVVRTAMTPLTTNVTSDFERFEAIFNVLKDDWYFSKELINPEDKLINDAVNGMIESSGDPHTVYMTADEVQMFAESIDRGFVGIGVSYFDNNGTFIIERVFIDSPAERAGVQPGDIIHSVDGVSTLGLTSDEIVDRVRGEENSIVKIEFLRGQDIVALDITRGIIANTAFGKMLENDVAFLEIYQFGTSTATEVKQYLEVFKQANAKKIIIDLRDNGGGYLTSLEDVGSMFVPKDGILIKQELTSGDALVSKSTGNIILPFEEILILVNENTASAAEVFAIAVEENIGSTIVGVLTYGKGTVQQQRPFSDGSALKYTVAEWFSPLGNKINGVGITPDVIVAQHEVMQESFTLLEEDESYGFDQVDESIRDAQVALDFLDYDVDRTDGYFSEATLTSIQAYLKDNDYIELEAIVNKALLDTLRADVVREWHLNPAKDLQLQKALELAYE